MNEKLWLEKACSDFIPDLPLWIIEYAWSKRMTEVLEVLGPPLWLEGDWCLLTLEEPCRIRVVAAEVWRIVQARDIRHFERVTKFLHVTYLLVPRLVTPIKHMKIMFGLQTLIIMWMLWNDQSTAYIHEMIESLFPNNLPQYYKCSRRHMELMQKNREDFKSFAHVLARDRSMREAYIRDLIEEQYGECYAQKLEERLSHYLEELDKAVSQPTFIEQVLKQSLPQGMGEKILKKLLSRDNASLASVLKRLLNCAVTSNLSFDDSISLSLPLNTCKEQREADVGKPSHGTLHVVSRRFQEDRLSQSSSKQLWISQDRNTFSPKSAVETCGNGLMITSTQMSGLHEPEVHQIGCSPSLLEEKEIVERRLYQKQAGTKSESERQKDKPECTEQMCSRHGKKMRSILQECSEEPEGGAVEAECSPTSLQSTSPLSLHTPRPEALYTHTKTSASPHQHSLSTNTSVSSHQNSSSTNISMSYIQEVSSNPSILTSASSKKDVTSSPTPSDLQIASSPPSSLQSSSSSKQLNTQRVNAEDTRDTAEQVLATVVFTEPSRASGHNLKLSLESQSFLMQSRWLQPHVWLYRLSREEECSTITSLCSDLSEEEQESDKEGYAFFDANTLYSDTYSESDSEDSDDPDYNPNGG